MNTNIQALISKTTSLAIDADSRGCLYPYIPCDIEHNFHNGDPKTLKCCLDYALDGQEIDDPETIEHILTSVQDKLGFTVNEDVMDLY